MKLCMQIHRVFLLGLTWISAVMVVGLAHIPIPPIDPTFPCAGFTCDDGECINTLWLCDGTNDCADGSDEEESRCDITVGFHDVSYTVEEGNTAVSVCVEVHGTIPRPMSVTLQTLTNGGTAQAGLDYDVISVELTFSASTTNQLCESIAILNDDVLEENEILPLKLTTSELAISLNPKRATITIIDNDSVTAGFADVSYTVEEDGVSTVCVRLQQEAERQVTMMLTTSSTSSESAQAGMDYVSTSVRLVYPPSVTEQCTDIVITDDDVLESDETLLVVLTTSDPAVTLRPHSATITIIDNNAVTVGFAEISYSVEEGEKSMTVCVKLGQAIERQITTTLNTDGTGTAQAGLDYDVISVELTFSASTTNQLCESIAILNDDVLEENETLPLKLTTSEMAISLNPKRATITIIDNDYASVAFTEVTYSVQEDDGMANICARLVQHAERPVRVTLATTGSGTAQVDSDFSSTTMVLTFPPNISKQCANVAIIDDDVIENNETLEVTLSTTDLAVIVEPHNTVITIIDDDFVTVGFVETSFSVEEGEKPVTVCVKLGQAIERQITTTLNTDSAGTAQAGSDYALVKMKLTFPPSTSEQLQCADIHIIDDNDVEWNETLVVTLTTSDPSVNLASDNVHITIFDNDGCSSGEFECYSGDECVLEERKCDIAMDCSDGSDEMNCPKFNDGATGVQSDGKVDVTVAAYGSAVGGFIFLATVVTICIVFAYFIWKRRSHQTSLLSLCTTQNQLSPPLATKDNPAYELTQAATSNRLPFSPATMDNPAYELTQAATPNRWPFSPATKDNPAYELTQAATPNRLPFSPATKDNPAYELTQAAAPNRLPFSPATKDNPAYELTQAAKPYDDAVYEEIDP